MKLTRTEGMILVPVLVQTIIRFEEELEREENKSIRKTLEQIRTVYNRIMEELKDD